MGKHKDQGCPFITLAEECNELAQAALKVARFKAHPLDIRPGTDNTYLDIIQEEFRDVLYQYRRVLREVGVEPDTKPRT